MVALQVAEFTQVLQQLPSSSLLAAAFITYLGGEPENVRQASLTHWCASLGISGSWSLIKFLASETELLTWKTEGMSPASLLCQGCKTNIGPVKVSPCDASELCVEPIGNGRSSYIQAFLRCLTCAAVCMASMCTNATSLCTMLGCRAST